MHFLPISLSALSGNSFVRTGIGLAQTGALGTLSHNRDAPASSDDSGVVVVLSESDGKAALTGLTRAALQPSLQCT
jgi:hypothetical protein